MPSMATKSRKIIEPEIEPEEEFEDTSLAKLPYIEDEDTITFKRSHFYSVLSVLTFLGGLFIGYVIWGSGLFLSGSGANSVTTDQAGGPVVEAPVTAQPKYTRYDIPTEGHYSIGPADAPITIVEFSDYQCPYCKRWHEQVYTSLMNAYPGKIRLVYRNLPLTSIHPDAQAAAEAAMCAGEQGAYWNYHDKLFGGNSLSSNIYDQYAQELNLDMTAFANCVSTGKYRQTIKEDSGFALNMGIQSTPTFFVNGLAVVGAQPLDVFTQIIDKELAGEIPTN